MEEKTIYDLKLHETLDFGAGHGRYTVLRVPGGWLYQYNFTDNHIFVPWNNDADIRTFLD